MGVSLRVIDRINDPIKGFDKMEMFSGKMRMEKMK
jgi:hypothetical protein